MLGKTANGLYWMFRYLERAENTSRLIETGQRIGLTRAERSDDEWKPVMKTAGVYQGYTQKYDSLDKQHAIDWMLRSKDNPSSVLCVIATARQNARLVRTAMTQEVWEAMNGCYMAVQKALAKPVSERDLPAVLGLIRQRTALVRGATHGTMLRNDMYDFARIGTFLERADATARILDVKYYVLLPSVFSVGSSIDNVQWETILRSVSARGGYRMVHGNVTKPRNIAQFLILDNRMPRSLSFCANKILSNLQYLALDYDSAPPSLAMANATVARLAQSDIDDIFDEGLHEYIQCCLKEFSALGQQIEIDFRFYE
ncbi:putative alpha-E superfamily protein [Pacificibacter maritimus]|uniref:Putative alpha-E superfamily protein n=1 Tax=Pacificibacter maritimus TaxID=762213 RepID=A0A3N4UX28_9RHOB|nr:alpha-E domain-containing protein [Pacificibacter maritimus]RPE72099.1 putative alpha-E superfamily protein [Pacificibacter maritimus]